MLSYKYKILPLPFVDNFKSFVIFLNKNQGLVNDLITTTLLTVLRRTIKFIDDKIHLTV